MSDESVTATPPQQPQQEDTHCAECNTLLAEGQDRESTDGGVFCRPCFNNLTAQVQQAVAAQSQGINYPMAVVGGLLGGAIGVAVWWGFTVLTSIAFGLVAVVIGFTVGKGVVMFSGDKRSQGLQAISVVIAGICFFYASYLVNRTFILRSLAENNEELILPLIPGPVLFFNVISITFGIMDFVFLAIVVWQAWKIPAPFKLAG